MLAWKKDPVFKPEMKVKRKKTELDGKKWREGSSDDKMSFKAVLESIRAAFILLIKRTYYFLYLHIIAVKWLIIELIEKHQYVDLKTLPKGLGSIVVTGGCGGIGSELVKKLLLSGQDVILGCQDVQKGNKLIRKIRAQKILTGKAEVFHLELMSMKSVKDFAKKVRSRVKAVKCLINNAGVMMGPYELSPDGFERHFQVNFLSHFTLTVLILPMILNNPGKSNRILYKRIINVSSCVGLGGSINFQNVDGRMFYSPHKAYMDTKLFQMTISNYWNRLFVDKEVPVRVISVHPGITDTELYQNATLYQFVKPFIKLLCKTHSQASDGLVYAALSPELEQQGGIFLSNCRRHRQNKIAMNLDVQKRLFEYALQITELSEKLPSLDAYKIPSN